MKLNIVNASGSCSHHVHANGQNAARHRLLPCSPQPAPKVGDVQERTKAPNRPPLAPPPQCMEACKEAQLHPISTIDLMTV